MSPQGAASSLRGRRRGDVAGALVGVDVGGTKIQVVVTDGAFSVTGQSRGPTPASGGPPAVVAAIADLCATALHTAGTPPVAAVGVGAPGTVDRARGVVSRSPNLAGWMEAYPLAHELSKRVQAPVAVENDVRAGMLGEHRVGAARGHRDVLGVWFGTGVGGAVILGGELRRGRTGACGEIGHVCVKPGGRRCGCGRRGCLEAYAGRASIERQARALLRRGHHTDLFRIMEKSGRRNLTSGVIAKALDQGDRVARQLLDDAVEAAGAGVASVCNVLDLDLVVVGGGLGTRLGEPFVRRLAQAMQPHLFVDGKEAVPVVPSALGDLAGALGAGTLAAEMVRAVRAGAGAPAV